MHLCDPQIQRRLPCVVSMYNYVQQGVFGLVRSQCFVQISQTSTDTMTSSLTSQLVRVLPSSILHIQCPFHTQKLDITPGPRLQLSWRIVHISHLPLDVCPILSPSHLSTMTQWSFWRNLSAAPPLLRCLKLCHHLVYLVIGSLRRLLTELHSSKGRCTLTSPLAGKWVVLVRNWLVQ